MCWIIVFVLFTNFIFGKSSVVKHNDSEMLKASWNMFVQNYDNHPVLGSVIKAKNYVWNKYDEVVSCLKSLFPKKYPPPKPVLSPSFCFYLYYFFFVHFRAATRYGFICRLSSYN
jgi:hypothetical protein